MVLAGARRCWRLGTYHHGDTKANGLALGRHKHNLLVVLNAVLIAQYCKTLASESSVSYDMEMGYLRPGSMSLAP